MRIEIPNGEIIVTDNVETDDGRIAYVVLTVRCYPDKNGELYSVTGEA